MVKFQKKDMRDFAKFMKNLKKKKNIDGRKSKKALLFFTYNSKIKAEK